MTSSAAFRNPPSPAAAAPVLRSLFLPLLPLLSSLVCVGFASFSLFLVLQQSCRGHNLCGGVALAGLLQQKWDSFVGETNAGVLGAAAEEEEEEEEEKEEKVED